MENLTTEQWMEKYPYLKKMAESIIFTTVDDVNSMKNGEKISVNGQEVVVEFLKRIVQDSNYYDYASRFLDNEIASFGVCYIIGGDTGGTIKYEKSTLLEGLEQLITSGKLILKPEEHQRYEKLKNCISFERFLEKINGNNYNIEIDGNKYSIPIERIIYLMQLSEEDFDRLCNSSEIKNIDGILKEHFIYASYKFFRENKVFDGFVMPTNIKKRFKDIQSLQKIDLQALNKHLETEDTKFKTIQLDSGLKTAILSGMPEDSSQLEKAIYIYIKMCKLLTYDDEYYAVNQKGPTTVKHKDVNYVSTINLTNNRVVCFEFNLIYSKLLDELGIKFRSYYKNMIGEAYGAGHANLEFRSGKFLVGADSVTSILQGDIMRSKLNQPLVGLKCVNKNQNTQQEFKNAVTKIYEILAKQELQFNETPKVEHTETFEELMNEYARATTNIQNVSLDEKLSILIDKVNSTRMVGIDSLSYILQLKKVLFNELERTNNIGISVIRSSDTIDANRTAMACAIISVNKEGFETSPDQTVYYYYSPNNELIPISKEELQSKFNDEIFGYIENDDPRISGIVEVGGMKK